MDLLIRLRVGPPKGQYIDDPPPAASGCGGATDLTQRGADGVVANSNRAAGGLSIPLTAPAGRAGACNCKCGRLALTLSRQRGFC
jgi:hypothetical protein